MILYFNKNGQLLEQLEYGAVARVGMTKFQIFAYFEGIDLNNYDSALIRFKRPDLNGSEYPDLFMVQASINYNENIEGSDYFKNENNPYVGYLFDFNTITDGSGIVTLLDTPGQWEASITLVSATGGFNVTGLVRFTVEGSVSEADDDETQLQYSTISNNIALAMAQKVDKNDGNYIRYNANLGINAAQGNLLAIFYPVGCLAYDGATNAIFKIDTVTPKAGDETHVYATISKVWQIDNPAVVDEDLSNTSENPVQNKVVTNALQNVREVAEGKCKSVVISYDATEPSVNDYAQYYRDDGTPFASAEDMTAYLNQNNFANSDFNTQNDSVELRGYYIVDIYNRIYVFRYSTSDYTSLKVGDIIYVIELDVPDRWVSESTPYEAEAMILETTKVDLSGFVKTDSTTQTIAGQKTFSGILECTSKFKLLGRFNSNLIPDGANTYNIGSQAEPLANVFTKGLKDGNNGTYGIKLPNTTGWIADKTLATTDQVTGVGYRHSIYLLVPISLTETYEFTFEFISSNDIAITQAINLPSVLNKFVNTLAFMTRKENGTITDNKACVIKNVEYVVNNFTEARFTITIDESGDTSGMPTELSVIIYNGQSMLQITDTVTTL